MQYVYIHESLAEYLVCGDTSFAVMNARIQMRNLSKVEDHKTGFQKQFEVRTFKITTSTVSYTCTYTTIQLLQALDLTPFDSSMSDGEAHPEKNRYTYNLPCQFLLARLI